MVTVTITILITITITITVSTMAAGLDDVMGWREMGENLYGRLIVQHGGVERAGVEEICIFYTRRFASRESVCGLLPSEIPRIERLRGNTELNGRLLGEPRLPGLQ